MLILVRHGRTAANAAGLLLGRLDPDLDDLGRVQAAAAAAVVGATARPARVVSSPLRRARRTAESFGLPVEADDRWVELHYGEFDGMPMSDVPAEVWARWRADTTFAPPGGESLAALDRRVRAACEGLAAEAADHDVVVVSHVSPIKAAVAWALGVGIEVSWRSQLDPGSLSRIAVGPRGPALKSFNEVPRAVSGPA